MYRYKRVTLMTILMLSMGLGRVYGDIGGTKEVDSKGVVTEKVELSNKKGTGVGLKRDANKEGEVIPIRDETDKEVVGGLHIKLRHNEGDIEDSYKEIVPTVTLELYSEGGIKLSTVVGDASNYDKEELCYNLVFEGVESFKKGDRFEIKLKSGDDVVKGIKMEYIENYELDKEGKVKNKYEEGILEKKGEGVEFAIGTRVDKERVLRVEGSKEYPYELHMETDTDKLGVVIRDKAGNPVRGKEFEIESSIDKSKFKIYTDSKGVLWLERSKVGDIVKVRSIDEGYEFEGGSGVGVLQMPKNKEDITDFLSMYLTLKEGKVAGKVDEVPTEVKEESKEEGNITKGVMLKIEGVKGVLKGNEKLKLELVAKETGLTNTYELAQGLKYIQGVEDGEYKVKVLNPELRVVKGGTLKVEEGVGVLDIRVEEVKELKEEEKDKKGEKKEEPNIVVEEGVGLKDMTKRVATLGVISVVTVGVVIKLSGKKVEEGVEKKDIDDLM